MTHAMTTKDQLPPLKEINADDYVWLSGNPNVSDIVAYMQQYATDYALTTLAQQAQEPVAWHTFDGEPDHTLKTDPDAFDAVAAGIKTYEIRKDDRGYKVGDKLLLKRTRYTGNQMFMRPAHCPLEYTGEEARRVVSHIQRGYGLGDDWVILSFATTPQPQPAPQAGEVTDEQIDDAISAAISFYTTRKSRPDARAEICAILALRPQAESSEWQPVTEDDLTAFEKFITERSQNAPFIPADANTLANATMHMNREVRAARALRPAAQPMTPDEALALITKASGRQNPPPSFYLVLRNTEAFHGITAQGAQGEQA